MGDYYQCAVGTWSGDKPNGQQTVRDQYSPTSDYEVKTEIIGNTVNGLWDGTVDWGNYVENGVKDGFFVSYTEGRVNVLYQSKDIYEFGGSDYWYVSVDHYGPYDEVDGMVVPPEHKDDLRGILGFAPDEVVVN